MTGEFLKKARWIQDVESGQRGWEVAVIASKCWPEILAVVEAAEMAAKFWAINRWEEGRHAKGRHAKGQALADEKICDTVDTLNKKAGEL